MVGGTVIEVVPLPDKVWVNVREGEPRKNKANECAVYVERSHKSMAIAEGDALWWQGRNAYWTPEANRISSKAAKRKGHREGVHSDIPITRFGYSGVNRPKVLREASR